MNYLNLNSILKTLRDNIVMLKTKMLYWQIFGLHLTSQDGLFGRSTISFTKVIIFNISGEGKVGYLTNNLKNGHLRNIEHFKKYSFAMHGIYGVEGDYQIGGVWLWRGNDIPLEWKDHQSYDYFTFKKLDAKNEADQKLANDYWTTTEEGKLVEGKPVYEAKLFH